MLLRVLVVSLLFVGVASAQVPSSPPVSGLCASTPLSVSSASASVLLPSAVALTGAIANNVLTASSLSGWTLGAGQVINGAGVPSGYKITGQLTGSVGAAGTYSIQGLSGSQSLTVGSEAMTAMNPACGTVNVLNDGSQEAFFQLGGAAVTAVVPSAGTPSLNVALPGNLSILLKVSPTNPYLAAITSASTTTLRILQTN